jgi:hypothetical protein
MKHGVGLVVGKAGETFSAFVEVESMEKFS